MNIDELWDKYKTGIPGSMEKEDFTKAIAEIISSESLPADLRVSLPPKFVEMDYKCDNCGGKCKIKIDVDKYGSLKDIDPPYFCDECDKLI
jgi:hypothetical protein